MTRLIHALQRRSGRLYCRWCGMLLQQAPGTGTWWILPPSIGFYERPRYMRGAAQRVFYCGSLSFRAIVIVAASVVAIVAWTITH